MSSFLVSTVYFLAILRFSLIPKWKGGARKAFWIGAVFMLAGYTLLSVVSFGIRPPSPVILFEYIVSLFTGREVQMKG